MLTKLALLLVTVLPFAAQADATKKPLPSDWKTAVCNLYIFADPNPILQDSVVKRFDVKRNDCVAPASSNPDSTCPLFVTEQGASQKIDHVSLNDKYGNSAEFVFSSIQDDMHFYDSNIYTHVKIYGADGKLLMETSMERYGQIMIPLAAGGDKTTSRFTFECDPDVDYGPGTN